MEKYTRNCQICQGSGSLQGVECVTCDGYGYRIEDVLKVKPGENEENVKIISEISTVTLEPYSGKTGLGFLARMKRKGHYFLISAVFSRLIKLKGMIKTRIIEILY